MNPLSQKVAIRNRMRDIHDYTGKLQYWKTRISKCQNSDKGLGFLSHLESKRKSVGRIAAYAIRTPKLLNALAFGVSHILAYASNCKFVKKYNTVL
ncbi:MAG: hypothetical protein ACK4TO_09850 [Candidatus Nitrosotenuis sp.]